MMRPIINPPLQQSTTTTAEATNTSTASSSVAGNWTAYVTDSDDVIFPSSSGEFSHLQQFGNKIASFNNTKLLDEKCIQSCTNNNNNNNNNNTNNNNTNNNNSNSNINNNHLSHQKHKNKILATGNGNGNGNSNGNSINVNINCERENSLKTNSEKKSGESTNILDSCFSDCDDIFTLKSKTNPITKTSLTNTDDDESNKLNTNLECLPLIELSPSKSITLVKQNSTSLIFTKKDINPVVHRKRITLVKSGTINTSNDNKQLTIDSSNDIEPIISHTNETILSAKKRHSFHWQSDRNGFPISTDKSKRKQIKSWYAVISGETEKFQDNYKNVTCTTTMQNDYKENNERAAVRPKLNHHHQQKFQEFSDHKHRKIAEKSSLNRPNSIDVQDVGHATTHITKYNRFEQLLKNLVGRKVSREPSSIATSLSTSSIIDSNGVNRATLDKEYPHVENHHLNTPLIFASPEIKIHRAPSAHNLFRNDKLFTTTSSTSTTSLNATMHQRLWSVLPVLRREGSSTSLNQSSIKPLIHQRPDIGLKKCETVSALTHSQTTSSFEPVRPRNRLRQSQSIGTCSRCSSILSLAANGSRYSLNIANGGFVSIKNDLVSDKSQDVTDQPTVIKSSSTAFSLSSIGCVACKLCLNDIKPDKIFKIFHCGCQFCIDCMKTYVEFEILEGAYDISCPDALCPLQGIMNIEQDMAKLISSDLIEKHTRFRLNREIELDKNRTWCPRAGCETICLVEQSAKSNGITTSIVSLTPVAVKCPTCIEEFCSSCKKTWHPTLTCEENGQRLAANGTDDSIGIPFDSDLIKCCPMCGVPIEKDEGCAQMMCKRCKHVFCWYCLASLDDDFLLRHYDKGPCKNKLGHSRASVVWHRAQVIGIFASFGILLLVASPLLLLAAPCIVCCKCRLCSAKIEDVDGDEFDPNDPQQNTR